MTRKINLRWGLDENETEKVKLLIQHYHMPPSEIRNLSKNQMKKLFLIWNGR
jgi:hypothetical protein